MGLSGLEEVQLICLEISGEWIGRIFHKVRPKPMGVIGETYNLEKGV